MSKLDKTRSVKRSDVYLVNKSTLREPVNKVYKTRKKSQSLLDHPRSITSISDFVNKTPTPSR